MNKKKQATGGRRQEKQELQAPARGNRAEAVPELRPVETTQDLEALLRSKPAIRGKSLAMVNTSLLAATLAVARLQKDVIRRLKRQVQILRTELRCQEAAWRDTAAGKWTRSHKAATSPKNRVVRIDSDLAESEQRYARMALDQASRAARGTAAKARKRKG